MGVNVGLEVGFADGDVVGVDEGILEGCDDG